MSASVSWFQPAARACRMRRAEVAGERVVELLELDDGVGTTGGEQDGQAPERLRADARGVRGRDRLADRVADVRVAGRVGGLAGRGRGGGGGAGPPGGLPGRPAGGRRGGPAPPAGRG